MMLLSLGLIGKIAGGGGEEPLGPASNIAITGWTNTGYIGKSAYLGRVSDSRAVAWLENSTSSTIYTLYAEHTDSAPTLSNQSSSSIALASNNIIPMQLLLSLSGSEHIVTYVNSSTAVNTIILNTVETISKTSPVLVGNTMIAGLPFMLTPTQGVIFTRNQATPYILKAVPFTKNGTVLTIGTALGVNSVTTYGYAPVRLNDTQLAVLYMNSSTLYYQVIAVSGNTATLTGAAVSLGTGPYSSTKLLIDRLSDTQYILCYYTASACIVRTVNIDGTNVTLGSALSLGAPTIGLVKAVSATQAVLMQADTSTTAAVGKCHLLTTTGTSLAVTATATLPVGRIITIGMCCLSERKVMLAYTEYTSQISYIGCVTLS